MSEAKTTLLIVDDHQLVGQGIAGFFEGDEAYEVIGVFQSAKEAMPRIEALLPDIVITDLDMPGLNGLEMAEEIRKGGISSKIILLTMHLNQSVVKKVMSQKIDGYLPKNADKSEVKTCVQAVKSGSTYYSPKAMELIISKADEIETTGLKKSQKLTEREREILILIAEGMSTREISDKLFIAIRTVETHRKSILEKLEVHNVASMVRIAVQDGLLE
ncbi:MAG: response regulator transcription factor [Cyclobacteriaceae bacterium]